jgi:endonuclease/exonuclease/phosphatase family metal-dependent hydrolase
MYKAFMMRPKYPHVLAMALLSVVIQWQLVADQHFTVATYNIERYLVTTSEKGMAKSEESKRQVLAVLKAMSAPVVALQEVGGAAALTQIRDSLKAEGLSYPYGELIAGHDGLVNTAILSQFPIVASRPHTNATFLLNGRRMRVQRGFAEVDIRVGAQCQFTLITAHLKSKLASALANEDDIREQEAVLLREIIDARLVENPKVKLILAGDLNDTLDSVPVKTILGKGKKALIDTRPSEKNGDDAFSKLHGRLPRTIVWTHYYAKEDTYSRIDYILLSPGMAADWIKEQTYVQAFPNWGLASDHRPIIATFSTNDK